MKDFKIEYGPVREISFRLDESDVIVKINGEHIKVGVLSLFNGRDRDTKKLIWDKGGLKRLFPDKDLSNYSDKCVQSGCQESDWWNPTDILERDLGTIS